MSAFDDQPCDDDRGPAVEASQRGLTLSQLMAGLARAVAKASPAAVWTRLDVIDAKANSAGHVYLEVAERDGQGTTLAQAKAVIWSSTAKRVVHRFEAETGVKLAAGIKLLVLAKPNLHAVYGLKLFIEAIDPAFTLGDFEAKKREIRARLKREGVFDANRRLPPPWDYTAVLVIAPERAAGLGDFRIDADRLERFGVCRFDYAHSRFQGEGAAAEIRAALLQAVATWKASRDRLPDAVVILRGGGAVNDLAWLNDYELAQCICTLPVPVITGIGHERDSTLLDEVACLPFDTPSKAIKGIEQVIASRAAEARAALQQVTRLAHRLALAARTAAGQADAAVRACAQRELAAARERSSSLMSAIRVGCLQSIRTAASRVDMAYRDTREEATRQLATAKQTVPALLAELRSDARQVVRGAAANARSNLAGVLERSAAGAHRARENTGRLLCDVDLHARRLVGEAGVKSQALMREIAGQGPAKTLGRGFAIVRAADGATITRAAQLGASTDIDIEFQDGHAAARTKEEPS